MGISMVEKSCLQTADGVPLNVAKDDFFDWNGIPDLDVLPTGPCPSPVQGQTEQPDTESDLDIKKWPVLDQLALRGFAGAFVELATRDSEGDPAAVLVTLLCRFGIEVGMDAHMMIGDTRHHARIFAAIVGATARGRKGCSAKPVDRLFRFDPLGPIIHRDFLLHIPARTTPGPLSSGEGLIFAVRDPYSPNDPSDDQLGDRGVEDKRLFVLDEEFGAALRCARRQGNTIAVIIRSAWDHGNLEPLTKRDRIKATGAHIGIVTHITFEELDRLLSKADAVSGFGNRFLWICSRRQRLVPHPEPMPDDELKTLREELHKILSFAGFIDRVHLTVWAKEYWKQIYSELSADHPGFVGAIVNRAEAQVMRLALIYALLDCKTSIEVDHLQAALAMWRYAEASAKYIFGGRTSSPIAQKILDATKSGPKSLTDFHQLFGNHVHKTVIEAAINELIASGSVTTEVVKTSGRPKTVVHWMKKAN
jgi:hypothetical protein